MNLKRIYDAPDIKGCGGGTIPGGKRGGGTPGGGPVNKENK